jgi:hypothetical protein
MCCQFYTMDFNPACAANLTTRMVDHGKFGALNVQLLALVPTTRFRNRCLRRHCLPFLVSDHRIYGDSTGSEHLARPCAYPRGRSSWWISMGGSQW